MLGPYVRGYHAGIDFGCPEGTPVYAAAAGVVAPAPSLSEYGALLVLGHADGWTTWYAHLMETSALELGQVVKQGQAVARSGNTGRSTDPHLHFELRLNGEPVDPAPYMQ